MSRFTGDKPDDLRIVDFGCSSVSTNKSGGIVGTPGYIAPESVQPPHRYDAKCDVWAVRPERV